MIAPLAKFIDWSVLQAASVVVGLKHAPRPRWKLEEALKFLNGPDFIPAASEPARLEFDGPRHFKFPTPRPDEVEENNIVHGRLYRCAERWQERPAAILLDGAFNAGYHSVVPLFARRVNRAGFNAVTWVAPCNLQRRSRLPMEDDCLKFAREMAQGVAEIRALTGWLLDEGCPSVGLLGGSYGGWLAGLTACSDARIACAVLALPGVRTRFTAPVVSRPVRETLQSLRPAHEALDATRLNLILSTPVIPRQNILLIEAIHDLLATSQPIEELWQKWEKPEIWRLPHGHISAWFAPGIKRRVLGWLAPRLNAPTVQSQPNDAPG